MKIKIVYIVSQINKANEFEWLIDSLNHSKYELSFVSIHSYEDTDLSTYCAQNNIPIYHIPYHSKKDVFQAIFKLYCVLRKLKPAIIHAHLFEGGVIGITAAWLARIKYRVYTRHHSNYHHKYYPNGLKFDKWVNQRATHIVSITEVVSKILLEKEGVPASKITLIHHGFRIEDFAFVSSQRVQQVKQRLGLPKNKTIIGVVSRYTHWKGVQDIIPAFKKYHQDNPNSHLVLANAKGDYADVIHLLLQTLPKDSYTEIEFETDNAALFRSFDVFIHTPTDNESEAFGQIYIEAFLSEVPCIFSLSGVANEIAQDRVNALIVPYHNSEAIYNALNDLVKDTALQQKLVQNGKKSANEFTFDRKLNALESLYSSFV